MGMESAQYGAAPDLIGSLEPGTLEKAVSLLPAAVCKNRDSQAPTVRLDSEQVPAAGSVKEGGLADRDGQIVVRRGDTFEPLTLPASVRARIRGMLQVRDAVREVFLTQLTDAADGTIVEARGRLNRAIKTAIFDRRTLERYRPVERVETAPEALLVSLNESGEINWPRMGSLTGKRASELQDELDLSPTGIPRVGHGRLPTGISAATCARSLPLRIQRR
jgi:hypothetical protein